MIGLQMIGLSCPRCPMQLSCQLPTAPWAAVATRRLRTKKLFKIVSKIPKLIQIKNYRFSNTMQHETNYSGQIPVEMEYRIFFLGGQGRLLDERIHGHAPPKTRAALPLSLRLQLCNAAAKHDTCRVANERDRRCRYDAASVNSSDHSWPHCSCNCQCATTWNRRLQMLTVRLSASHWHFCTRFNLCVHALSPAPPVAVPSIGLTTGY